MEGSRKNGNRRIALVAGVVCTVALVAIGVMMWHPWDPGVAAGPESGEQHARDLVAEAGGEWLDDDFGIQSGGVDWASVQAYYPGDVDENAIAAELETHSEVEGAGRMNYVTILAQGSAADALGEPETSAFIPA